MKIKYIFLFFCHLFFSNKYSFCRNNPEIEHNDGFIILDMQEKFPKFGVELITGNEYKDNLFYGEENENIVLNDSFISVVDIEYVPNKAFTIVK